MYIIKNLRLKKIMFKNFLIILNKFFFFFKKNLSSSATQNLINISPRKIQIYVLIVMKQ
jgi:hypothetical protein